MIKRDLFGGQKKKGLDEIVPSFAGIGKSFSDYLIRKRTILDQNRELYKAGHKRRVLEEDH